MHIRISIPAQTLELISNAGQLEKRYLISSAKNGAGEENGSFKTPRGKHIIRAKIGAGLPSHSVFVRRRPTGEIWTPELYAQFPNRDWILSRILWLSGTEPGFNRLGRVDTMRRYIYLHGSSDFATMGVPGSIGCIRMRNVDIIELFDRVPPYTPVDIVEFEVRAGDWAALKEVARPIREQVFVQEQGVPLALEWDDDDASSQHVVAYDAAGIPMGTGRLLPDGHIGRLAVLPSWRGRGVGKALFERLLELAHEAKQQTLVLHAQAYIAGFYAHYGFQQEGEVFMEAGIPHVLMARTTA